MKWFRGTLHQNRVFVLSLLSVLLFALMDMRNFVYAYQEWEAKEEKLREISEFLDIPVDDLRPEHQSVYQRVQDLFGIEKQDPVKAAGLERLRQVLQKHEDQLAANPYLPQIEKVKREHAPSRIEGMVRDIVQLTQPKHGRSLSEGSQRALLRGLDYGLRESLELPIDDNLPAKAQRKHAEFQADLNRVLSDVYNVVAETQREKLTGTVPQKVGELKHKAGAELARKTRRPRYLDRGLPNQRVERNAVTRDVSKAELDLPRVPLQATPPLKSMAKDSIDPEIQALAEELDFTPSKIFSWVHDQIEVDPKWGATKSPLGTLREKLGTSWDQAWLLQQLLVASGVDARLEWGEVQLTPEQLHHFTGVSDPWRAGDMVTTGGTPFVLLTQGSQAVAARMDHVWVKAHVAYKIYRGAAPHSSGDTWVRMDPTLKRHNEAEGIQLYDKVPFTLESYLLSGTTDSPRRSYEDALWSYIRANNIECATLEQVKRARSIQRESFPFVPGTLRAKVTEVKGEAPSLPESFQYRLALNVRDTAGRSLLQWSAPWPQIYGKRLELAWPGASGEDQATLDAQGGVFETPPYLVDLKPSLRLAGSELLAGQSIGSADDIEIHGTLTPPAGESTFVLFQGQAGERNVFAIDLGTLPQTRLGELQEALNTAKAGNDLEEVEAATLAMIGASYMNILSRDLEDLAEWKWQRVLELGTFGTVIQAGDVQTTVAGSPLSFSKGPLVTDVASMPLGFFHVDGNRDFGVETFELVGSQSSYLEGIALDMVVPDETMTAVTFLTRAVRDGQQLHKVESGNVETVLAAVELGESVEDEIRAAVNQGKIAWVSDRELQINQWRGAGYIIEDPETGAAGYLGTGGYGVGALTGKVPDRPETLGEESWLGEVGDAALFFLEALGLVTPRPETQYGDPVNLSNGNLWMTLKDLELQAPGLAVAFGRTYNSQNEEVGDLGLGWTHSFSETLRFSPSGDAVYREGDGTKHVFKLTSDQKYASPKGKFLTLEQLPDGHRISMREQFYLLFDQMGEMIELGNSFGRLLRIERDTEGKIKLVSDRYGREVLRFEHSDGKISRVSDFGNRAIDFRYENDLLIGFTDVRGQAWNYSYGSGSSGNLLSEISGPLGVLDGFSYDHLDRNVSHVDALGFRETISYGAQTAVVSNKAGATSYYELDQRGRVTSWGSPLGEVVSLEWNDENQETRVLNSSGASVDFEYGDSNDLKSVTQNGRLIHQIEYGEQLGLPVTIIDSAGSRTSFVWSDKGALVEQRTDEPFSKISFEYDDEGRMVKRTDGLGNSTSYGYLGTTFGSPTSIDSSDGTSLTLSYNLLGQPTEAKSAGELFFSAAYLESGDLKSLQDDSGITESFSYDELGRPVSVFSPSRKVSFTHDVMGRVTSITGLPEDSTRLGYNTQGFQNLVETAAGQTHSFLDTLGRTIGFVDEQGYVWTFEYCGSDKSPCSQVDPLGGLTTINKDINSRVSRITDADGNSFEFERNSLGQITKAVHPNGYTKWLEYLPSGLLKEAVETLESGVLGTTRFSYDDRGLLLDRVDANGNRWSYTYNQLGKLTGETDPLGNLTQYLSDARGQTEEILRPDGTKLVRFFTGRYLDREEDGLGNILREIQYDEDGRVVRIQDPGGAIEYSYNQNGQIASYRDSRVSVPIEFEYDVKGRIEKVAKGDRTIEREYDARGQLSSIEDSALGRYRFTWDPLKRLSSIGYPNGTQLHKKYSGTGKVVEELSLSQNGDLINVTTYSYDSLGRPTSIKRSSSETHDVYKYDLSGRLKEWRRNGEPQESYTYDRVGNRLSKTAPSYSVSYTYDQADRLVAKQVLTSTGNEQWDYSWNPSGKLLRKASSSGDWTTYHYSGLDQLERLQNAQGENVQYEYDGLGQRVLMNRDGQSTILVKDPISKGPVEDLLEIRTDNDSTKILPDVETDSYLGSMNSTGSRYYHSDSLGTPSIVTDQAGEMLSSNHDNLSAFGEGSSSEVIGFTGRIAEPHGHINLRSRTYDPADGRFTSKDQFSGFLNRPQSQNAYAYVENSPLRFRDPTGANPLITFGAAAVFWGIGAATGWYFVTGVLIPMAARIFRTPDPTDYPYFDQRAAAFTRDLSSVAYMLAVYSVTVTFVLFSFWLGWASILGGAPTLSIGSGLLKGRLGRFLEWLKVQSPILRGGIDDDYFAMVAVLGALGFLGSLFSYSDAQVENGQLPTLAVPVNVAAFGAVGLMWGVCGLLYLLGRAPL